MPSRLWKPENVKVTKGAEFVGQLQEDRNERPAVLQEMRRPSDDRPSAARAGRRLCGHHPELAVPPGVHVNYAETVLPMKDGLPKLKDFPAEMGGSGVVLAE